MITELYTFSTNSFVVAEEWNANFKTLYSVSEQHEEAINIGWQTIAFPDSDFTQLFAVIKSKPNSSIIDETDVTVAVEQEFYKTLYSGQDLNITIPHGMDGESRILVYLADGSHQRFFSVKYPNTLIIEHYNNYTFWAGYYYIMIYEGNNIAQVKLIWTGV